MAIKFMAAGVDVPIKTRFFARLDGALISGNLFSRRNPAGFPDTILSIRVRLFDR